MKRYDRDLRIRPGRIRDSGRSAARLKSFAGQSCEPQRGRVTRGGALAGRDNGQAPASAEAVQRHRFARRRVG
jgi:hypothetical protein